MTAWSVAVREAWPAVVALVAGGFALAAQLDLAPGALAADAIPAALTAQIRLGAGVVETFGLWPTNAVGPVYPLLMSVLTRAWPAFPDGLVLVAVVDAALLAGVAGLSATAGRRSSEWAVADALPLIAMLPLVIALHGTRAGPLPLAAAFVTVAVYGSLARRRWLPAVAVAAAALTWPGAALVGPAVAASQWERDRVGAGVMLGVGFALPVLWWGATAAGAPWAAFTVDQVFNPWTVAGLAAGVLIAWPLTRSLAEAPAVGLSVLALIVGGSALGRAHEGVLLALPLALLAPRAAVAGLGRGVTVCAVGAAALVLAIGAADTKDRLAVRVDMLSQGIILGIDAGSSIVSDRPAHLAVRLGVAVQSLDALCVEPTTHAALVEDGGAAEAVVAGRSSAELAPLFRITDGPALLEVRCD